MKPPLFTTFEDFFENLKSGVDNKATKYDTNHEIYVERILTMMQEYAISMAEAIEWDMDGFPDAPSSNEMDFQYELDYYFWNNGIQYDDTLIYRDIIFNNMNDIVIKSADNKNS